MSKKIVIFGGSFDPPHQGHKEIVERVLNDKELEKIIIVPCFIQPHKYEHCAGAEHRIKMLNILFHDPRIEISSYEVDKKGYSYTIDTYNYFSDIYKDRDIYLLIGEDSYENLSSWKDSEKLCSNANFIVVPRQNTSLGRLRLNNYKVLEGFSNKASSSKIREKLKVDNVDDSLDPSVYSYIRKNKLYGEALFGTNKF